MLLLLFLSVIFLNSCSFNGTLQGLFSYYNKTSKISEIRFVPIENNDKFNSFSNNDSAIIYITNGNQLHKYLEKYEKSIVYIWSPKCKSTFCYSLNLIQKICKTNNAELFIVAEYYDAYFMSKNYTIDHPIMGIDVKYYKTNITSKYLGKFILDLTNHSNNYDNYGNFLSFNKGKFERTFNNIDDI